MAQHVTVRLSRGDNSPWGFRLQGGKDFGQPLLVQKVNGGSPAERAGLQVGDALIRVNNIDVSDMRHKEAQDTIVRAGNSFELSIQRGGGSTWRPQVSPVGQVPPPGKASPAATVTKTSLAAGKSPVPHIGAGHNLSPKPFGPQVNGDPSVKAIVNKQYNTPVQMYSEETIAETLSAQAEVLAGGAIGVNFMKNEKTYDSQKSEVFKMVQEVDKEPREPDTPGPSAASKYFSTTSHAIGGRAVSPRPLTPLAKEMGADSPLPGVQDNPPCSSCGKHIVGVFVRIKDKNLHVECFKCATCGTSLKNVGYYNINNKLYCDIHAKMVARQNPPAPNLEPVTVPPGGKTPSGAFFTPQACAAPQSPQPGTLAPLPFHAPRTTTSHVVAPWLSGRQGAAPSGPKPFSSVPAPPAQPAHISFPPSVVAPPPAPFSSVPAPSPFAPSKPAPARTDDSLTPVVWPPTSHTHVHKSETKTMSQFEEKRLSICSEEVSKIASRDLGARGTILEEERPSSPVPRRGVRLEEVERSVVEAGERVRRTSPRPPPSPRSTSPRPRSGSPRPPTPRHFRPDEPDLLDISSKPHEIHSLLPPASLVRPMSPKQVVVFPPELPAVIYSRSPTPHRKEKRSPERCTTCPSPLNALVPYKEKESTKLEDKSSIKPKKETHETCKKSGVCKKENQMKEQKSQHESQKKTDSHSSKELSVKEHKVEKSSKTIDAKHEISEEVKMDKMFYSKSEVEKIIHTEVLKALSLQEEKKHIEEVKPVEVSVHDLPKPIAPSGKMATALTTASERPFTPVPFPKPMELPSISNKIVPLEPVELKPVPLPAETTPYFPPPPPPPDKEGLDDRTARALREVGCRSPMTEALTVASDRPYSPLLNQTSFKPIPKKEMSLASALTVAPTVPFTVPGKTPIPMSEENVKPCSFKSYLSKEKEKFGVDMIKIAEGGHTKETVKSIETGHYVMQQSSQNEKHLIPYYQENIGEIPVRNRSISPVPHRIVAPSVKPTDPYIPQPYKKETRQSRKDVHEQSKKSESEKVEILHTKTVAPRPTTPSGLHPPEELPYYQQHIGVIPIRNKSISPVPHITKAPQLDLAQTSMQQGYKSTVYSETKTFSAQKSSLKNVTTTNVCTKTELKPPERLPSPQSWKLETKRTVQNLSPIAVRLPSPRPVTPVQGEVEQAANAKVQIHRPRPSSPLPPTIKVQVDYPQSNVVPVTAPSIGSEKSAFASVKNGNSQVKKPESKFSIQKESCPSKCSEVCQKKSSDSSICSKVVSESCQKTSQVLSAQQCKSQATSVAVTGAESSGRSSEIVEQRTSVQKKSAHAGITSFRAYGETSNRTIKNEEAEKSSSNLKLEHAIQSKTFVETTNGRKKNGCESVGRRGGGEGPASNAPHNAPLPTFPSLPAVSDVPPPPGPGAGKGTLAGATAPKRGRGILNQGVAPGARIPLCGHCNTQIRGPFITALGKIWCPEHFVCVNPKCKRPLADIGFVEEQDGLYCEFCFEQYLAPTCDKCHSKIKGDCLNAIGKHFHPECFSCAYCGKLFGNNPFFLEDALPYCENDWNELFTTKCFSCGFPIEAGDRWVEALNNNYHSQCFNCSMCKKNLEGQSFFAKGGRPFCKNHAR